MKHNIEIELSDAAFELLKGIGREGYAEYRDTEYNTLEDFQDSVAAITSAKTDQWFLNRNSNGTYHLIPELCNNHLIESDDMAWHSTYRLSNFGKKLLKFETENPPTKTKFVYDPHIPHTINVDRWFEFKKRGSYGYDDVVDFDYPDGFDRSGWSVSEVEHFLRPIL